MISLHMKLLLDSFSCILCIADGRKYLGSGGVNGDYSYELTVPRGSSTCPVLSSHWADKVLGLKREYRGHKFSSCTRLCTVNHTQ
ncbi:hypothetical protein M758_11G120900 [Ceratodon purpureus]|nr:hypothetical protein M758_11G120900 [Ceratodon purpureus]